MENLNKDNENSNINVIENNEHLIVVKNPKLLEKENKNWKFFYKIKNSIKAIYGLGDDKYNEKEDLDFIYTNYSHANEEASLVSKVIFTIVVGIFTIFLIWATFAEIDELARGAGKVIPTDKVQTVQSLDGGIISEIFIKEGDIVKFDAPLMKIDTTRFQATLEESRQEYLSLLALKARLEKEATINIDEPLQELVFDEKILQDPSRYDLNEKMLYENRYKELKSSISVLATQESQKFRN